MNNNNQFEEYNEMQYLSMSNDVIEGPMYLLAAKKVCTPGQAYIGSNGATCYCNSAGRGWVCEY